MNGGFQRLKTYLILLNVSILKKCIEVGSKTKWKKITDQGSLGNKTGLLNNGPEGT